MSEMTKAKDMIPYDFREMEKRDEEQILLEMQGQVVKEMIYQFPSGSRTVTGISWVGIKEIARRYGKIDTKLIEFQDLGDSVMFIVKAIDIEKGTGLLGTATQSKNMKRKDGSMEPDPFAVTKALSKAQRNAIRSIIPEAFFKAVFAELAGNPPAKRGSPPHRKDVQAEQGQPSGVPSFKNGKGVVIQSITPKGIMDYLAQSLPELKREDFTIVDLGGAYEIKTTRFIDYWGPVNGLVEGLGGEWISFDDDKKRNHWWLPKKDEEGTPAEAQPASEPSPPDVQVSSIEELEAMLKQRIPGMEELVDVTQDGKGFSVEPRKTLDSEIVETISYIVEGLGGRYEERQTGVGYEWLVPFVAGQQQF